MIKLITFFQKLSMAQEEKEFLVNPFNLGIFISERYTK